MFPKYLFALSFFPSFFSVNAQCATAGYVPCLAPGQNVAASPPALTPTGGSGFWSSLQSAASAPIIGRDLDFSPLADGLKSNEKRQSSLCCRPSPVECLHTNNVPFCYNPQTTRLYFSDGSVAYMSNKTFYGSDGTFVDFNNGIYQYPDGNQVHFTPVGTAASGTAESSNPSSASSPSSGSVSSTQSASGTSSLASARISYEVSSIHYSLIILILGLYI